MCVCVCMCVCVKLAACACTDVRWAHALLVLCPWFVPTEQFGLGKTPTTRDAQAISDQIFASFVSKEVDKVELVSSTC